MNKIKEAAREANEDLDCTLKCSVPVIRDKCSAFPNLGKVRESPKLLQSVIMNKCV